MEKKNVNIMEKNNEHALFEKKKKKSCAMLSTWSFIFFLHFITSQVVHTLGNVAPVSTVLESLFMEGNKSKPCPTHRCDIVVYCLPYFVRGHLNSIDLPGSELSLHVSRKPGVK